MWVPVIHAPVVFDTAYKMGTNKTFNQVLCGTELFKCYKNRSLLLKLILMLLLKSYIYKRNNTKLKEKINKQHNTHSVSELSPSRSTKKNFTIPER